jgi:hypothetical protein
LSTRAAISLCCLLSDFGSRSNHSRAPFTESCATSLMWFSAILTASASGFRRLPLQALHGTVEKYFSRSSRAQSLSVSFQRRARLLTTPSNGFLVSKLRMPSS